MKVLLLTDVPNLGSLGDELNVKPGFARNFLVPQKKAIIITDNQIGQITGRRNKLTQLREHTISEHKASALKIDELDLIFEVKSAKEGTLFAAVTEKTIVEELAKNDIKINEKHIMLADHIKKLGKYTVPIVLHSEVRAQLKLSIIPEKVEVVKVADEAPKAEKAPAKEEKAPSKE